jgi:hypothetical protein
MIDYIKLKLALTNIELSDQILADEINARVENTNVSTFLNERTVAASPIINAAAALGGLTGAIVAAGISLELLALSSPEIHSGTSSEKALKAELFRQARVRYLSDGLDIGISATADQIVSIADMNPTGMISAFRDALLLMPVVQEKWTKKHFNLDKIGAGDITIAKVS